MKKYIIPLYLLIFLIVYIIGCATTTTTDNLELVKPAAEDDTVDWFDTTNDNMDLIDAAFSDVLAYDTTPVLRGNLDIGAFNIEGVDATEFGYLDGVTSGIQTQFGLYYLKTQIDTETEMETIWGVDVTTSTELSTYCETTQDYLKTSENDDTADDLSDNDTDDLAEGTSNLYFPGFTDLATDYSFTDNSSDWDTAYGWGDWSGEGFITDITGESIFDLSDVSADPNADKFMKWDDNPGTVAFVSLTEADITDLGTYLEDITAESILDLSDTPANYTEASNKFLQVNGDGNAIIFDTITEADISDLGTTTAMVADKLSVFASTTSAELAGVISDETGSGKLVFDTSPTLITPTLGVASGTSLSLTGLTASQLVATDADKKLQSLAVATYPSLTEIAYVKGVTSAIQTQLGTKLANVVEDTTPQLGGDLDCQNKSITATQTVRFNGLYDNGNSGAGVTINWNNGQYQKVAVSENTLISFSNAFVGTLTLNINYSGDYTVGFNAGYTIKTEGGKGITFTKTNGAFDILKVYYYGTANTYVVGVMNDVK